MKTQTITDEMAEESLEPQKNLSQDWLGYQCGFCGRYLFNKKKHILSWKKFHRPESDPL